MEIDGVLDVLVFLVGIPVWASMVFPCALEFCCYGNPRCKRQFSCPIKKKKKKWRSMVLGRQIEPDRLLINDIKH